MNQPDDRSQKLPPRPYTEPNGTIFPGLLSRREAVRWALSMISVVAVAWLAGFTTNIGFQWMLGLSFVALGAVSWLTLHRALESDEQERRRGELDEWRRWAAEVEVTRDATDAIRRAQLRDEGSQRYRERHGIDEVD